MNILIIAVAVLLATNANAGQRIGPGVFQSQRGDVIRTKFVTKFVSRAITNGPALVTEGACYSTLAKWGNKPSWSASDDLVPYMLSATGEWNSHIPKSVIGKYDPNSSNTIRYEALGADRPVALTYLWSKQRKNRLVPYLFRIILNTEYNFVDGSVPDGLDLLSVLTHESGHAIGMGHTGCTDETMYRYISYGETKKRDLGAGDIEGLNALY